jgi:hypothetical protein
METLRGGTTTKVQPLESDRELDLLGDLVIAVEATVAIMKTKVAFTGITRFSRWRRAFIVR